MYRTRSAIAGMALMLAMLAEPAAGQPAEFYAGKTLRILIGLEAGGTVDTWARMFAAQLRKHIPGQPNVVLQNMPSAAGVGATNFIYEKAEPDGLTILFNSWDPLAQALGDQGLRARYDHSSAASAMCACFIRGRKPSLAESRSQPIS
jgi:tripartite-type tricarboxylate transporter receptor subunit TctC